MALHLGRLVALLGAIVAAAAAHAAEIVVRPEGPIRTLADAQRLARGTKATVIVHAGTYRLAEPLVFTAEDSGTEYRAAGDGEVVVSGGTLLDLAWEPCGNGIVRAQTPAGLAFDQVFINGVRQPMARYPDSGFAADAFGRERASRWREPTGGFIHAMHRAHWGGFHYRITGRKDDGELAYEGGWQNNRQMGMHREQRWVENIREELDAPGEWFHDARTATLYFFPPAGVDPETAVVEVVRLRHLLEFTGTRQDPVRHVTLRGFVFRHAARTFMDTREPLLRSDWTVYRGGAVLFSGAEDCTVADCEFDQLGGNAIFVNNYNRRITIRGCDIHDTGASAVAFVGSPASVRSPLFEHGQRQSLSRIDRTPGPRTDDHPADCLVEDCLLRRFGLVEKQATGVEISMSMGVTIRHCSIYEASRAGINISEGTFGGHVIEFCDVFDTVRETGDHGSFNSWGRDRFWHLDDAPAAALPELAMLDVVRPNVIRNSRWRCDHGWDVDLDDGSSNYEIYNNLFLRGGLKLREGFRRKVRNNIALNNTLHPHVWYADSGDEVTANIWMAAYRPAGGMPPGKWGAEIDRNLFTTSEADRTKFAAHGCDAHSLTGDPQFVDPATGDFRVKEGSPALKLGFVNFPMDQFGVRLPRLRAIARTPEIPPLASLGHTATVTPPDATTAVWLGATVTPIKGEEFSAFGVGREEGGLHLLSVPEGSVAAACGLRRNDLLQSLNETRIARLDELFAALCRAGDAALEVGIVRDQKPRRLDLGSAPYLVVETAADPTGFTRITPGSQASRGCTVTASPRTVNDPLTALTDGGLATSYGPVFPNGVAAGGYKLDLGAVHRIAAVSAWSHARGRRDRQRYTIFGSASEKDPGWNTDDPKFFQPLGTVDTGEAPTATFRGTSLRSREGSELGEFRWIVWRVLPVTAIGEHAAIQELGVEVVP